MEKDKNQPVYLKDEQTGVFTLNREFSWFENLEFDWVDYICSVFLETDEEGGETAERALRYFKEIYAHMQEWDKKFRKFSAEELIDLGNDWLHPDGNEEMPELTKQEFADRISISEISISPDGEITAYYDDDEIFWGHIIEISASADGTLEWAGIAG